MSIQRAAPAIAIAGGVWLFAAARVSACSPDFCEPPVRTFGPQAVVPSNLIRFAVIDPSVEITGMTLKTDDGELVPASFHRYAGDRLAFMPDVEVAHGIELTLTYWHTCREPAERSAPLNRSYTFSTTEQQPLEVRAPRLRLIEQGVLHTPSDWPTRAFKRFEVETALVGGLGSYLVDHALLVDSRPAPLDEHGGFTLSVACEPKIEPLPAGAECDPPRRSEQPGEHQLDLSAYVVGEDVQPEMFSMRVEVSCDTAGDASAEALPLSESMDATMPPATAGAGCAVRSAPPAARAWPIAVFAAIACLARSARLRRAWPSTSIACSRRVR